MTQKKHDLIDAIATLHCAAIEASCNTSISDTMRNARIYLEQVAKLTKPQREAIRVASGQAWIVGRRQLRGAR